MFNPMQFTAPPPTGIFEQLKETWGAVVPLQEPWRGIKTRQLRVPAGHCPAALAYSPATGKCLVVVETLKGEYRFTHWEDAAPALLEKLPYEELICTGAGINALAVPSEAVDGPRASQVFVAWCKRFG